MPTTPQPLAACGVCAAEPAPWTVSAQLPPTSPVAIAERFGLCDTCHRLVQRRDAAELAERLAEQLPDLPPEHRSIVVAALLG